MSEPIAVAFVEVRPETESFRSNAEQELRQGLGDEGFAVRGDLELRGLPEARRDVDQLTQQLRGVSGQQLQFEGLEDAGRQSGVLAANLAEAASVDVAAPLAEATRQASTLATEAQGISEALSGIPGRILGPDLSNLNESADAASLLGDETEALGASLNDTATAASAVVDVANLAARSERVLAASSAQAAQQLRQETVEEERLIRVRARRASSLGPFRLAGIGLGIGTAVFAATRALGDLSEGLRVTGDDASTTQGKLRNLGASILSGDIVGAFKSLTDNTRSYNIEQLKLIAQTPQAAKVLREMGEGANIAKSQLAALEGLTQVPQFLQTRIAGADLAGDDQGQLAALQEADRILKERTETIRGIGLDQATLNAALEEVFRQRKGIADQIKAVTAQARPEVLAPLVEAVTDARLTGDATKILAALRAERGELQRVIDASETNADDRRKFKDQLVGVNREIESVQSQIIAEQERHRQAMIERRLAPSEEAILDAEIAGTSALPALNARRRVIEDILSTGMLEGKRLTRDERVSLKAELAAVNSQIESAQDEITSENQRHADAMKSKLADADQAFLASISGREQRARNRQLVAQATASLGDDIRVSEQLQAIFRESIAAARKTINDARLRAETIATLTTQLLQETQNERTLRQQQRRERIDRRAESLDLDIQIAQANNNTRAEIRAHRAKIRFLQERIRHTREGTNQRKRLILELRQEQAAVRELLKEGKDQAAESQASFQQLAFAFLAERDRLAGEFASNINQPVPGLKPPRPRPTPSPPAPPTAPAADRVTSPLPLPPGARRDDQGRLVPDQGAAAQALRERGGAPASSGQLEALIALTRDTNRLLNDIRRGVGHAPARASRAVNKNAVETSAA